MDKVQLRRDNLIRWLAVNPTPQKEKSLFSQLKGTGSFGEKVARRLEKQYNMGEFYLDTPPVPGVVPVVARRAVDINKSQVSAVDPDDTVSEDVVFVPESRIEFHGGSGRVAMELVEDEEPATYRRSWFQKYGINPARVRRFRVSGDSMEPFLYARDTILVNMDETNVVDGKLYAMRYGEGLKVKYLSRRIDGTLLLRSVNPAYAVEEIEPQIADEHISIIGRVRDRSGTGGL